MKKITSSLAVASLMFGVGMAHADPKADLEAFQNYFKERFPTVELEAYKDGVNAIPQYAERRPNWEMQMEFPPYDPDMDTAREMWGTPFKNGKTYADCFKSNPPANKYPYWKDGKVHTIEADINSCREANGEAPIENVKTGDMALLVAAFKEQFNGEKMTVDVSDPGMQAVYEKGKEFFWTKRGQLNMACADCHVNYSGNKIRGDVLSPSLGHGTGFPVYRTAWAQKGKPWGTIHRRYDGCNKQVRAQPFKAQGPEYTALQVYEYYMDTGVPLEVPSLRQ